MEHIKLDFCRCPICKSYNYEVGFFTSAHNCRWTTSKEQANNRTSNVLYAHDGKVLTQQQWCEELGISLDVVLGRRRLGAKTFEEMFLGKDYVKQSVSI